MTTRPRPSFRRHDHYDYGYSVIWAGATVGAVVPVFAASHIRRGRLQADPHWQAIDTSTRVERPVGHPWRTRLEAGQYLVDLYGTAP